MPPKRKRSRGTNVAEAYEQAPKVGCSDYFVHSKLTNPAAHIRLLTILPGEESEDIACHMRAYDLASAPSYGAFSYTWGPAEPTRTITVDGSTLSVRYNCFYALWQARTIPAAHEAPLDEGDKDDDDSVPRDPAERYLWIDSISINQDDLDEKAVQVRLMGRIYRNAKFVFVSLGPHADGSQFLLERMQDIVSYVSDAADHDTSKDPGGSGSRTATERQDATPTLKPRRESAHSPEESTAKSESSYADSWNEAQFMRWLEKQSTPAFKMLMDSWVAFVDRPYWRRLWVLQELILSNGRQWILCGDTIVAFSLLGWFETAWETFRDNGLLITRLGLVDEWEFPSPYNGLTRMMSYMTNENIREDNDSMGLVSLYGIKDELAHLLCYDPRDRIYGIQEVVRWPSGPDVEIDYSKSPVALLRDVLAQWCAASNQTYYSLVSLYSTLELWRPENKVDMQDYLETLCFTLANRNAESIHNNSPGASCAHDFPTSRVESQVPQSVQTCDSFACLAEDVDGTLTINAIPNESECFWSLDGKDFQYFRPVKAGSQTIALVPPSTMDGDILLRPADRSLLGFVARKRHCNSTSDDDVCGVLGACVIRLDRSVTTTSLVRQKELEAEQDKTFQLCISGTDQLRLMTALYLHASKPRYSPDFDLPGDEALTFMAKGRFMGDRFSSYAMEVERGIDADTYHALETRRFKRRVCRRCGVVRHTA